MPGLPKKTKLVLEEQPKWGLLHDILEEIEHDIAVTNARDGKIIRNGCLPSHNAQPA